MTPFFFQGSAHARFASGSVSHPLSWQQEVLLPPSYLSVQCIVSALACRCCSWSNKNVPQSLAGREASGLSQDRPPLLFVQKKSLVLVYVVDLSIAKVLMVYKFLDKTTLTFCRLFNLD